MCGQRRAAVGPRTGRPAVPPPLSRAGRPASTRPTVHAQSPNSRGHSPASPPARRFCTDFQHPLRIGPSRGAILHFSIGASRASLTTPRTTPWPCSPPIAGAPPPTPTLSAICYALPPPLSMCGPTPLQRGSRRLPAPQARAPDRGGWGPGPGGSTGRRFTPSHSGGGQGTFGRGPPRWVGGVIDGWAAALRPEELVQRQSTRSPHIPA